MRPRAIAHLGHAHLHRSDWREHFARPQTAVAHHSLGAINVRTLQYRLINFRFQQSYAPSQLVACCGSDT